MEHPLPSGDVGDTSTTIRSGPPIRTQCCAQDRERIF